MCQQNKSSLAAVRRQTIISIKADLFVDWTLSNNIQCNLNLKPNIFIQEIAF